MKLQCNKKLLHHESRLLNPIIRIRLAVAIIAVAAIAITVGISVAIATYLSGVRTAVVRAIFGLITIGLTILAANWLYMASDQLAFEHMALKLNDIAGHDFVSTA